MVAYALGRLRSAEAIPALLRLLHDPDRHVREYATDALGSLGGPAAIDALLALAGDQDPQRRIQAAKALGKVFDADSRVATPITMLAGDAEAAVRAATLSGLASAGSTASTWVPLVVELANDPDPAVRQSRW
jgi:HEAT repeat protein